MIKHAANACAVFGKCLPSYMPPNGETSHEGHRICHGCERFTPAPAAI